MLRRYADAQMHMIRFQMSFYYLAFFLFRNLGVQYTKVFTYRTKYHLLSSLRNKHYMIFAIPLRMTKTLVFFHLILLTLGQVRRIRETVSHGQTLLSPPAEPGDYLIYLTTLKSKVNALV